MEMTDCASSSRSSSAAAAELLPFPPAQDIEQEAEQNIFSLHLIHCLKVKLQYLQCLFRILVEVFFLLVAGLFISGKGYVQIKLYRCEPSHP